MADFRDAVKSPRAASRLAAAVVISRSDVPTDAALMDELLRDSNDQVSLVAAQGLIQRGGSRGLSTLIRLLDSEQLDVRREAAAWLCGTTGQECDYSPFAKTEERQMAMTRWREWLSGPGATAVIQPPQRMAVHGRGDLGGHTLIATGGLGKISELDGRGNVVWQHAMQAWSAEKLPGGHVLVASHWENRVCELDERGKVVWEHQGLSAIRAKPLPGGRVLIADFSGNRVVEADQQGTIIWQHETPDQCFDAERLTSGNTLFACPNLIREVAPSGETVRQWTCEGRVNSLQVLPSGRLLLANYGQGRVVELDDTGRVTWEHKIPRPSDAFRLPGGRTLITTAEQIIEIDLAGRTIREISAAVNGGARQ
jgi:outer membrane protein assembly factor BamB